MNDHPQRDGHDAAGHGTNGNGADGLGPLPSANDPHDPEATAVGEGWSALDQLIRGADLTRFDAVAQARLVRRVERRGRRRMLVGWGAAAAVAAALLLMLSIGRGGREQIAGEDRPPVEPGGATIPDSTQVASPSSSSPSSSPLSTPGGDRALIEPPTRAPDVASSLAALRQAEATRSAAGFWSDEYDADIQSTRLQAREVELSWQRGSEPLDDLRQRFDELQADWDDRSL